MTDTMSTASTVSIGSAGGSSGSKFCIICAGPACDKILNDSKFQIIMDLYWKGIRVDVKPEMNKNFDLCFDCFDSVLSFYQINDVLVHFESRLKELQRGILSKNLKGILRWQEKGMKLNKVQSEIMREWGTKMEPVDDLTAMKMKVISDVYKETAWHEDGEGSSSSSKRSSEDKDTTGGKSSVQSDRAKRSPHAKRSSNGQQKGGPKKRKLRRGRTGDTSDDDESEGSNFSDEVSVNLTSDDEATGRERSKRRPILALEKECRVCLDKFESSSTLQKHIRQHKVGENDGKYECRYCSQQFNRQTKLVEHKKTCNNDEEDGSSK